MTLFVVIAIVMVAIALAWVIVPLVRGSRSSGVVREASNVAILRDQLRELDNDLANGSVAREQYDQARRELEQRVLEESKPAVGAPAAAATTAPARGGRRTVWAVAAAIPVLATALYVAWGNHEAFSPVAQAPEANQHDLSPERVNQMVAQLAQRLEKEPDNPDGWLVLARTYYALGRYGEATKAFEHAIKLIPDDPNLLADYADALAATQNSLQGKPSELVAQALKIDPRNWKALALAGTAAFDRKDYKQAVAYWEQMKQVVPPTASMAQSVDASIAEARALGGLSPADVTGPAALAAAEAAPASAPVSNVNVPAMPGSKIEGTVALAPQLLAKASPEDTVFIFARAENARMPLAIVKRQVKDLPTTFALDDSMAMTPNMTISSVPAVVIGARVSKSGTAMPQSGDLEGMSAPVKAGTSVLKIVIDRALP